MALESGGDAAQGSLSESANDCGLGRMLTDHSLPRHEIVRTGFSTQWPIKIWSTCAECSPIFSEFRDTIEIALVDGNGRFCLTEFKNFCAGLVSNKRTAKERCLMLLTCLGSNPVRCRQHNLVRCSVTLHGELPMWFRIERLGAYAILRSTNGRGIHQ